MSYKTSNNLMGLAIIVIVMTFIEVFVPPQPVATPSNQLAAVPSNADSNDAEESACPVHPDTRIGLMCNIATDDQLFAVQPNAVGSGFYLDSKSGFPVYVGEGDAAEPVQNLSFDDFISIERNGEYRSYYVESIQIDSYGNIDPNLISSNRDVEVLILASWGSDSNGDFLKIVVLKKYNPTWIKES